jgi:hypothetical protein
MTTEIMVFFHLPCLQMDLPRYLRTLVCCLNSFNILYNSLVSMDDRLDTLLNGNDALHPQSITFNHNICGLACYGRVKLTSLQFDIEYWSILIIIKCEKCQSIARLTAMKGLLDKISVIGHP